MKFNLISKPTFSLSSSEIEAICRLKNQEWNFGIKSQLKWFKKNIKKNDLHNCLFLNFKLIGYTSLRKKTFNFQINNKKKVGKYFLLDTIVIHRVYRKKNFSKKLMKFNNKIIKKSNLFGFLICEKKFIDFYKIYKWKDINKIYITVPDHLLKTNCMIYNKELNNKTKLKIFFKK